MVYDTCFDMLQHMMLWTLVRTEHFNIYDRYGSYRLRWPSYAGLMKKIRKETSDKHTARSRHHLYRFLPIPKAQTTTITVRKYTNKPKNVGRQWKKHPCSIGIKNGKYSFLPEEKVKTHAFDQTPEFNCEQLYRGGGWKFHWFHTTRMDKVAKIIPNVIRPILPHQHSLDFPRPQMVLDDNILDDIYMTPPDIEITGTVETPEDEEEADKEKAGEEKTDKEKEEDKKKEGAEEKTDEKKKKDGEKAGTEEEKDKEKEKDKDKEAEKEGEKDKEKSKEASKKDDAEATTKSTPDDKDKDKEKDKSAKEATPKPNTPETAKDTDTPPATDKRKIFHTHCNLFINCFQQPQWLGRLQQLVVEETDGNATLALVAVVLGANVPTLEPMPRKLPVDPDGMLLVEVVRAVAVVVTIMLPCAPLRLQWAMDPVMRQSWRFITCCIASRKNATALVSLRKGTQVVC